MPFNIGEYGSPRRLFISVASCDHTPSQSGRLPSCTSLYLVVGELSLDPTLLFVADRHSVSTTQGVYLLPYSYRKTPADSSRTSAFHKVGPETTNKERLYETLSMEQRLYYLDLVQARRKPQVLTGWLPWRMCDEFVTTQELSSILERKERDMLSLHLPPERTIRQGFDDSQASARYPGKRCPGFHNGLIRLAKIPTCFLLALFITSAHAVPPATDVQPYPTSATDVRPSSVMVNWMLCTGLSCMLAATLYTWSQLTLRHPAANERGRRGERAAELDGDLGTGLTPLKYLSICIFMLIVSMGYVPGTSLLFRLAVSIGIPAFILSQANTHIHHVHFNQWWLFFLLSGTLYTWGSLYVVAQSLYGSVSDPFQILPLASFLFVFLARWTVALSWHLGFGIDGQELMLEGPGDREGLHPLGNQRQLPGRGAHGRIGIQDRERNGPPAEGRREERPRVRRSRSMRLSWFFTS